MKKIKKPSDNLLHCFLFGWKVIKFCFIDLEHKLKESQRNSVIISSSVFFGTGILNNVINLFVFLMSPIPRNIDFDRKEGGFRFYLLPLFQSAELSTQNLPIDAHKMHFLETNVVFVCISFLVIKQNTDKIDIKTITILV